MSHRTLRRQILKRLQGRAREYWDQFDEYDLQRAALRQANIRENKGPSLGKIQVEVPQQRSPCAVKLWGQISRRDCKTRAMRPRRRVETCQKYLQAQRKGQSYILFACRGVDVAGRIHNKAQGEFVVDSGQICTWSATKTLTLPNWKP